MNINLNQNPDTLVFTGPSLPPEEARLIFPQAQYHEPIQCGDIIKAMRMGIQRIVIIDGYFEQRGAVWHKEILFALSQGIEVFGASSMGALRAAELSPYGMIGFGKIFELYQKNITLDDDEVALVHAARFDSHITPMVNIRATLEQGIFEQEISKEDAEKLINQLKNTPYYNRSIFNSSEDPRLNQWLQENYIDQKRQDAMGLLQALSKNQLVATKSCFAIPKKLNSIFFNRIFREILVEPFEQPYPWLNSSEKILVDAQNNLSNSEFKTLQRIAKCLHLGFDISQTLGESGIESPIETPNGAYEYLLSLQSFCPANLDVLKHSLEIEAGLFNIKTPSEKNLIDLLANMLMGVIGYMTHQDLSISAPFAQKYADEFRRERGLTTLPLTLAWMKENNLKETSDFEKLIMILSPLHHIIDLHNAHSIGVNTSLISHNFLNDALALSKKTTTPEIAVSH